MRTQLNSKSSPESSEEVQELKENGSFIPITFTGILWVIGIVLGISITLMIFFVSLAFWFVTKNPLFIISTVIGGTLFIIWGYINLKDKEHMQRQIEK